MGKSSFNGGANGRISSAASAHSSGHHDCFLVGVVVAAAMLCLVTPDVRNEGQESRSLDRRRELALVARARPAQSRGKNLSLVGDEAAEGTIVLVVDPTDAALAEWA